MRVAKPSTSRVDTHLFSPGGSELYAMMSFVGTGAPGAFGAVTDVTEGEAVPELVGDEVEEVEDVDRARARGRSRR